MKTSVIAQLRNALKPANRVAAILGSLFGALPPVGSYCLGHHAVDWNTGLGGLATQPCVYAMIGFLAFSATKVSGWAAAALSNRALGLAWTVGVEVLMTLAPANLQWLSIVCLGYLVAINALASANCLVEEAKPTRAGRAAKKPGLKLAA
jgi:hypothetical protein